MFKRKSFSHDNATTFYNHFCDFQSTFCYNIAYQFKIRNMSVSKIQGQKRKHVRRSKVLLLNNLTTTFTRKDPQVTFKVRFALHSN